MKHLGLQQLFVQQQGDNPDSQSVLVNLDSHSGVILGSRRIMDVE